MSTQFQCVLQTIKFDLGIKGSHFILSTHIARLSVFLFQFFSYCYFLFIYFFFVCLFIYTQIFYDSIALFGGVLAANQSELRSWHPKSRTFSSPRVCFPFCFNMAAENKFTPFPHFSTNAIHEGQEPEQWKSMAVVPPISPATTFKQFAPAVHTVSLQDTIFILMCLSSHL